MEHSHPPPSERTRIRRLPARGDYDPATIHAIIDEAWLCHVGVATGEGPRVIPMFHSRVEAQLFLHGSPGSRLLRHMADGAEVCLTFTLLDGLVLARSAFHHSMNYRSAVLFGRGREVVDSTEKRGALKALTNRVYPGRWEETRPPNESELRGTLVVAVPIEEASAKIRVGPPKDDPDDLALPHWAGVMPLALKAGKPIPAENLSPEAAAHPPRGLGAFI